MQASDSGDYDEAVRLALEEAAQGKHNALATLIDSATSLQLADSPQWRSFLHYKPVRTQVSASQSGIWLSEVDAPHFFLSQYGKRSPEKELFATLAALYSNNAKPPLRLSAYCRFVARRYWLAESLPDFRQLMPQRSCEEFDRYTEYLDADILTLVFPSEHPNSPSSAFGHTLLRIDKKDQRAASRLLNMSINFAAEVPENVTGAAYAIRGLTGGFPGRFRMLPYHIKLREYGQIENRDTWEYELELSKPQVDLIIRHSYEMLVSEYDYYFFKENCSYHLLSLLEVAFPDEPLTNDFNLWTIPVDTIRLLRERGLATEGRFVPSSINTLKARSATLSEAQTELSKRATEHGVQSIDQELSVMGMQQQVEVLDLLADHERYQRLRSDTRADASNEQERAILSRRSKLDIRSVAPPMTSSIGAPDAGHGTARLGLKFTDSQLGRDRAEISFRPAYHDFRDPSYGYGGKSLIELGLISVAFDRQSEEAFINRFTLVNIQSLEPRSTFFKPISWHTRLLWNRPLADARHELTFNVGAGAAWPVGSTQAVFYALGETYLIDAPARQRRRSANLGGSTGIHWQITQSLRTGLELNYNRQLGGDHSQSLAELWVAQQLAKNLSLNVSLLQRKQTNTVQERLGSMEIRYYF